MGNEFMQHKPGCIWSDDEAQRLKGCFHRVPIECCTVEDLQNEIKKLREEIARQQRKMEKMALELYESGEDPWDE